MARGSITSGQLTKLFALHLFSTMIAFMLSLMVRRSGFNAPLGIAAGAVLGLGITYVAFRLGIRRPEQFFVEYGKQIVGKWLHYPLMLYAAASYLLIAILNFWELQDFLTQFYLINTPPWAIAGLCGICIAYTVRFGIKSVFRSAEGIFYLSMCSFLLIPLLVGDTYEWFIAKGILTHFSLAQAWPTAYYTASVYGEMGLVIFLFPYLSEPKSAWRPIVWAILISAAITLLHIGPVLLTFGVELASNLNYPELELLRFMKNGTFLETLDPALIALWLISIFVKLGLIIFIVSHILSHMIGLRTHKPIVIPITLLVVVSSLSLFENTIQFHEAMSGGILTVFMIGELIPALYFVVDSVKSWFGVGQRTSHSEEERSPA
ncbi:GerAB/ArcD/ProY family transporter [Paenibacillus sp. HB172176]|uniref:GerAB/ArcD/ProY family transporter n=1 Tax=Paenibacillus sp. HB172176 TaxID=2493690 RepID=UPI0014391D6D|nr:GerAB/ArcD/ProY family transporter [Paenibacillus sp. HB172176]